MEMWVKHPRSKKPDAMLTIVTASVVVVLYKVLVNGTEISPDFKFGTIDAGIIAALLTPTLGSYVARKWKDPISPERKKNEEED